MSRIERNSAIDTGLVDRGGDDDADADRHARRPAPPARCSSPRRSPSTDRYGVILSMMTNDSDEDHDADEREHQGRLDVVNDVHHFPPVKRRKPPYTGRYEPGLSRTDLGTVRASLTDVSRQPRYSRGPHQADHDESVQEIQLSHHRHPCRSPTIPRHAVIAFLPAATLERRRAPRRQNRRQRDQHQRDRGTTTTSPRRARPARDSGPALPSDRLRARSAGSSGPPERSAASRNRSAIPRSTTRRLRRRGSTTRRARTSNACPVSSLISA